MDGVKITNQERGNEVGDRRRYAHNYGEPTVDAPVLLLLPIGQVAFQLDENTDMCHMVSHDNDHHSAAP